MKEKKKLTGADVRDWIGTHYELILSLAGGILSVVGGGLKLYCLTKEYGDKICVIDDQNQPWEIPAKHVTTINKDKPIAEKE